MDQPVGRRIFADDFYELERLSHFLRRSQPSMSEIKEAICEFYCIRRDEIEGRGRTAFVVLGRQIFCFFARKYTRASLRLIGSRIGGLDHTTVIHAIRVTEQRAITRPLVRDDLDLLSLRIADKVMARGIAEPKPVAKQEQRACLN